MKTCERAVVFLFTLVLACLAFRSTIAAPDRLGDLKLLIRDGKYVAASDGARKFLAEVEAAPTADSLRIAIVLDVLVEALVRGGKPRQAETADLARRSLGIRERRFGPEDVQVATSLTSLGNVLLGRSDINGAQPLLERALAIREKSFSADDPEIANTLTPLGQLLRLKSEYKAARPMLERALAIRENAFGLEDPEVATAVANLGSLYGDLGDYPAARKAYERALAIREKTLRPDHPAVAMSCDNLGQVLRVMGENEAAKAILERALAIREKTLAPDDPIIANSLVLLGLIHRVQGDYSEARAKYERAAKIREQGSGPEDPEFARILNNLANLLRDMGNYDAARPLYERALAIREKVLGPMHPDVANTLDNLGLMLSNIGDYPTALGIFQRAMDIRKQKQGPEHANVAYALRHMGGVLERQGDLAGARKLYERSLAISEKAMGPLHPDVAMVVNDLAGVDMAMGRYPEARALCERGLRIRENEAPAHQNVAESLQRLGDILVFVGQVSTARESLEHALAINENALGHLNPVTAENLYRLGRVHALEGDIPGAFDRAIEAERIARGHLRITASGLAEREALRYESVGPRGLDLALTLAARGLDGPSRRSVFDELIRSRALVLDEMASRHRASGASLDTAVARRRADFDHARERLAALMVRGVSDSAQRRAVDDLRVRCEVAERGLAEVSRGFAQELSRGRIGLDEVAASLPPGSALVSLRQYRRIELSMPRVLARGAMERDTTDVNAYAAFVLRAGDREPAVVDLGSARAIDGCVARWTSDASSLPRDKRSEHAAERAVRQSGAALRRAMWDPIAAKLGDVTRVFVVPDGSLNLVSLAALPAPGGGYLIEHGPALHHVSAERDLVPSATAHRGAGLLAVGAVDYDAPVLLAAAVPSQMTASLDASSKYRGPRLDCEDLAAARFEPLAATGAETHDLVELWTHAGGDRGEALELRERAADESAFKHSAPGRRVLHLATHGFFLGRCGSVGGASRGIGGLAETHVKETRIASTAGDNPLRLSGIVFAGANHRANAGPDDEDGILTAEEIASLDLSAAEWVVLSACETGIGDVHAGEGVFGLRRGFQIAGAGTLIMSLWSVDDEATRAWMQALYQARLERHLDSSESVRQAGVSVLKSRRAAHQSTHPFYWAGFIAAGDWR